MTSNLEERCYGLTAGCCKLYFSPAGCCTAASLKGWETLLYGLHFLKYMSLILPTLIVQMVLLGSSGKVFICHQVAFTTCKCDANGF